MNENKKKWDEKFKLALNELEGKIGEEDAKTSGRGRTRRTHREKYATKAEWKRAAFRQEVLLHIDDVGRFSADNHRTTSGNCQSASGVCYGQQQRERKRTSHLLRGDG